MPPSKVIQSQVLEELGIIQFNLSKSEPYLQSS